MLFTAGQLMIIQDALGMAAKSNLRAMNTRTQPEFKMLYAKIDKEINDCQVIVRQALEKLENPKQK